MKYSIKTADNKFWIGINGEYITSKRSERAIYETKELAKWYIDNTNIWGSLVMKEEIDLYDANEDCDHILDENNWSGMKCKSCNGWFCY